MAAAQVGYQLLLVLSILVSAGTAGYVWVHRDRRGALPLSVVFASAAVWGIAALVESIWPTGQVVIFVSKVILVSVVLQVVGFLLFALAYTGRESYVTRRTAIALSIEPVIFTALVWTNSAHQLVWEATTTASGEVEFAGTPIFWIHTAYSYGLMATGVFLIVVFAFRSKYLYQRQATALVVATIAPWVANFASLTIVESYHLTPIAFALTAVVLSWAVVSEKFLDMTPVATELVLDTIETAVFVVDEQDRIVDYNERAVRQFDIEGEMIVGEDVRELLADSPSVLSVYEHLADQTESATDETTIGDQHVRIQMSPLREHDDRLVGRAYMIVDLTEQREREKQLQRRNEQLDRFAGVVSHDLRNPLEVAAGSLQLARETGADEDFERAERAHARMDQLIEDILVLARQETQSLDIEPVDIGTVAQEAWRYVETGDAAIDVQDSHTIGADPDRLGQLFENCFRNSIEHGAGGPDEHDRRNTATDPAEESAVFGTSETAAGRRSQDKRARVDNDDAATVSIGTLADEPGFFVSDDGPGFSDIDLTQVFDAGYTTDSDGTGFGLSIVDEIATLHGWSVAATDSESGGARIEVRTGPDS